MKLKKTIKDNDNKRREKATEIIRKFLLQSFPDSNVNVSLFKIHQSDAVLQEYYAQVDKWKGVDLSSVRQKEEIPKWKWEDYLKRADNWWNRYKAKWVGDKIYYPLFKTGIGQFIMYNGCHSCARAAGSRSDNKSSDGPDYNHELLKAMIMKEVMKTPDIHGKVQYQVSFPRSRSQPMILRQSYSKAELLMELFRAIGRRYKVEYPIVTSIHLCVSLLRSVLI